MAASTEKMLKEWLSRLDGDLPELYLVGGVVRDMLLSRMPRDIDLMCRDAESFAKRLAATRDAVVVPFEKKADEPCYRVVLRQHPESFIDIASMRGDTVFADLERRDFTVNAIALRVGPGGASGEITDPLNGRGDLAQCLIRAAGPDAFISDPLRILRAVRFAAELGFTIEENTLAMMKSHAQLLKNTAFERIFAELLKIFAVENTGVFVRMMDSLGILSLIFPEIIAMKGCTQNSHHHLDVWNHSLLVLENCEYILTHLEDFFAQASDKISENLKKDDNRLSLLKLTAMIHDAGKPGTRAVENETGRITFYGHDKIGAEMVSGIAQRLRMSGKDQAFIQGLVAEHLHILNLSHPDVRPATRMRLFRNMGDDVIPLIIHGMADISSTLGPDSDVREREAYLEWAKATVMEYYENTKKQLEAPNFVTGNDLIAMGMSPGPEMGRMLREIREAQDTNRVKDREEALSLAKSLITDVNGMTV